MRTNFEKMPKRQRQHEEGYKRHKKTQRRGSNAKRMDWDQLQTNIKAAR